MIFSIQREELLKALRAVSGGVDKRHLSAVLSCALFKLENNQLQITTSNQDLELSILARIQELIEPGQVLLPFKKILEICKACAEGDLLTIQVSATRVTIIAGKSRFVVSGLAAEQFPKIYDDATATTLCLPKKVLRELITRTAFAMAEQDVRYFLNGLCLSIKDQELKAVAADGHRLAVHTIKVNNILQADVPGREIRVILPRHGVVELARVLQEAEETISLSIGKKQIRYACGGLTLISNLIDGKFPDHLVVTSKAGDKVILVDRNNLRETLLRTTALLDEEGRGIILHLEPGKIKFFTNNKENDLAEDEIAIAYLGEEIEVGINAVYLLDYLSVSSARTVKLTLGDERSSILVEDVWENKEKETKQDSAVQERSEVAGGVYVIMPMRA